MSYLEKNEREQSATTEVPNATCDFATFQAIVTASVTAAMMVFNAGINRSAPRLDTHATRQEVVATPTEQSRGGRQKRKYWNKKEERANQGQPKKQTIVAPTTRIPVRPYLGGLPLCNRCSYHHHGPCEYLHCNNCNRVGHTTRSCKTSTEQTIPVTAGRASPTCYGCGKAGHFRRNCPEKNKGNNIGNTSTMGHWEAVQDPTMGTGMFPSLNLYTCLPSDSCVGKSLVNHKHKKSDYLLAHTPYKGH